MWNIAYPCFCFSEPRESMLAAISRANAWALSDSTFFPSCFFFFSLAVIFALSEEGSNEKQSTVLFTRLVWWLWTFHVFAANSDLSFFLVRCWKYQTKKCCFLFHLAQWFINPNKISLWAQHPTWVFSSFWYSFIHKFSYQIGLLFLILHGKYTETWKRFSKLIEMVWVGQY